MIITQVPRRSTQEFIYCMEASLPRAFHEGTLRVIARDTEDDSRGIVINKTLALLELGWGYSQLTNDKFERPDLPTLWLSSKPCVCCFLGCPSPRERTYASKVSAGCTFPSHCSKVQTITNQSINCLASSSEEGVQNLL